MGEKLAGRSAKLVSNTSRKSQLEHLTVHTLHLFSLFPIHKILIIISSAKGTSW